MVRSWSKSMRLNHKLILIRPYNALVLMERQNSKACPTNLQAQRSFDLPLFLAIDWFNEANLRDGRYSLEVVSPVNGFCEHFLSRLVYRLHVLVDALHCRYSHRTRHCLHRHRFTPWLCLDVTAQFSLCALSGSNCASLSQSPATHFSNCCFPNRR